MGQDVIIRDTATMGDVLVIDTDRSFTGQDGHTITADSARHGVPGLLADRLFATDPDIDYVYVLQNVVTVRRQGGWDDESASTATGITGSFLRHYPDAAATDEEATADEEDTSEEE